MFLVQLKTFKDLDPCMQIKTRSFLTTGSFQSLLPTLWNNDVAPPQTSPLLCVLGLTCFSHFSYAITMLIIAEPTAGEREPGCQLVHGFNSDATGIFGLCNLPQCVVPNKQPTMLTQMSF